MWRTEWEPEVLKVLRSGKWFRGSGGHVADFEAGYARLLGAKRCLGTASGTTALMVSLHLMGGCGRRGDCLALHFHRDLQRASGEQGAASLCRHRSDHTHDRPRFNREPDHRPHARHPSGAHLRHAVRHGPNQCHRQETQAGGH
ncbi:MAG: hypothetical protein EXS31_18985 [Pedosphaera sp.]|nr:hypothetical protein [Pedosphaera sp.]